MKILIKIKKTIGKIRRYLLKVYRDLPYLVYCTFVYLRRLVHLDPRGRKFLTKKLNSIESKSKLKVILCAFPEKIYEDIEAISDLEVDYTTVEDLFRPDYGRTEKADLFILLAHGVQWRAMLTARKKNLAEIYTIWMYDNHVSFSENRKAASVSDVYFPSHAYAAHHLANKFSTNGGHLPVPCAQFTLALANSAYHKHRDIERSDKLYGGFVDYTENNSEFGLKRNNLIRECMEQIEGTALSLTQSANFLSEYAKRTQEDRFVEWKTHKVSLSLPIAKDLGCRFFDALITGQIPIVPKDIEDFDKVVPAAVQDELPVVRLEEYSADAVKRALKTALQKHNEQGAEGMLKRHEYVVKEHMNIHRLEEMIRRLKELNFDT